MIKVKLKVKQKKRITLSFILSIILSLAIIFFNYAAVVSDSDGSAFVTKGEFEAMKVEFDSQMDKYNGSLVNKIDGAIASYLAGIKIVNNSNNLFERFIVASGDKPKWYKNVNVGTDSANGLSLNGTVTIYGNICSNLRCYQGYGGSVCDTQLHIGGSYTQGSYARAWVWYYYVPTRGTQTANFHNVALVKNSAYNSTSYPPSYAVKTWHKTITQNQDGSGARWLSQKIGNINCLKFYCTNYYVQNVISYHSYYYFSKPLNETYKSAYLSDHGKDVTSITLTKYTITPKAGATVEAGNDKTPSDAASDAKISFFSTMAKVTDGNNYLDAFWSIDSNKQIYVYDEDYNGDVSTTKKSYTVNEGTFEDFFYKANGANIQTNNYPSYTFEYYPIELKNSNVKSGIQSYCNNTSSTLVGEPVYNGGGMPFAETTDPDRDITVSLKLKCSSNAVCNVKISDKQFVLGNFAPDASQFASGNVTCNAANYSTFEFTVPNKGFIWLYLVNTTNNDVVTIEDIRIKDR